MAHKTMPVLVREDAPVIPSSHPVRVSIGVCLVLLLSGCAVSGLSFRIDDRLQILRPADREEVSLPVTIEWDIDDFDVIEPDGSDDPGRGYFGVFVDRAPQPPGQTVEWFAKDDESCRPADGCPDEQYLADRGVYTTTETQFVVETLPPPPSDQVARRELHEVTIVLFDGSGRRIGESAFTAEFEVQR
jgi:hypothetical protein